VFGINRASHTTSGVGSYENTNAGRAVNNVMRYGLIKDADYEKGLVKVDIQDGDLETAWLPWITLRSGKDRFWWAPEVDERVLVLAPCGELHNGVVMAAQISSDFPQIADKETVQRTLFDDGTVIEYDRENHVYTVDATASGQSTVNVRALTINIEAEGGVVTVRGGTIHLNP
jgi:phage baseplate assembly protein V